MNELESGFFVAEPAWHGLGVVLTDAPKTAKEAIVASGLDWSVHKTPLMTSFTTEEGFKSDLMGVNDHFAITRYQKDMLPHYDTLGVVGNRYTPLQNIEAFNFFDEVVATGNANYHTAGSLKGGKIVWMLAKVGNPKKIIGHDFVENFILLYNSHDGSSAVTMQMTPIRVVCANTLAMAQRNFSKKMSVRHTKTVLNRMKDIATYMGYLEEKFEETADVYRELSKKPVTNQIALQAYLKKVYVAESVKDEEISQRAKNTMAEVELLTENGVGMDIAGDMNYWRAYNAITEHVDYHRNTKNKDQSLNSSWLGQGMKIKEKALAVAMSI